MSKNYKTPKIQQARKIPAAPKAVVVAPEVQDYLLALVEPAEADPVPVPSPLPYRRTNVREILEIDLKDHYVPTTGLGGECYLEVRPTVQNTVAISANSTDPITTASMGFDLKGGTVGGGLSQPPVSGYMTRGCVQTMHSFQSFPSFQVLSDAAPQTITFKASLVDSSIPSQALDVHVRCYSGGTWTQVGVMSINATTSAQDAYVCPGTIEAIGFFISSDAVLNYELVVQTVNYTGTGLGCPNVPASQTVRSMQLLQNIPSLEQYGVTALSVLATYQGSDLANGGKLYSAWVPDDWAPPRDIQLAMSQLVYDRYDGPLKKGTHCHWVPQDLDELEMVKPTTRPPANKKLVIYIIADDISQSTRLRVCQHQQYYTQLASFGTMSFGPSSRSLSVGLAWLACNVPMCTENDEHFYKKVLKLLQRGGKRALRYAIEHPEQIAKVASLIL